MVLVGNKKDLVHERQVSEDEGKILAGKLGLHFNPTQFLSEKFRAPFVETSVKTNENVSEAFYLLVRQINKYREAHPSKKKKKQTRTNIFLLPDIAVEAFAQLLQSR